MSKLIVFVSVLALSVALAGNAFATPRTAKTQCQKWALEDDSVKPWELSEYVKACTAEVERTGAMDKRFRWDRK